MGGNVFNGNIFHIMVFNIAGSGLDIEFLYIVPGQGPGGGRMFHKGAKEKVGIPHSLGGQHVRMPQHIEQGGECFQPAVFCGGIKNGAPVGKARVGQKFFGFQAVKFNPGIFPRVIAVCAVMDDVVGFNKESRALM